MIVTWENLDTVLAALDEKPALGLDSETTGLRPYHGDEPFSFPVTVGGDE